MTLMDANELAVISNSDLKMYELMKKMKKEGQSEDEDYFTDYVLDVNSQGFIEEFYRDQRCHR